MNILFTICGRAGSKGIKNKNIKEFLVFPLPFYTVSVIDLFIKRNPDIRCDTVLNTDSKELINIFEEQISLIVDVIKRAAELGRDNTPKIAVISNCMEVMQQRKEVEYDIIIDLDLTSPLRTVKDVSNLIEKKMNSSDDVVF
jgi:CMP-N,N'-diacetyllegionaminic acid synthase